MALGSCRHLYLFETLRVACFSVGVRHGETPTFGDGTPSHLQLNQLIANNRLVVQGSRGEGSDGDSTPPEREPLNRSGGLRPMFRSTAGVRRHFPPLPARTASLLRF